jgi:NADH:ubiquinone oxidoreductase subunit
MFKKIAQALQSVLSVSSTWSIRLETTLFAKHVGTDGLGNRYFTAKARRGTKRERRFVLYANMAGGRGYDASQVPPEWHGWLHHQTNDLPATDNPLRHLWQTPPQANTTGTGQAYFPPGHPMGGGKRDKATGDYQAWTPSQTPPAQS